LVQEDERMNGATGVERFRTIALMLLHMDLSERLILETLLAEAYEGVAPEEVLLEKALAKFRALPDPARQGPREPFTAKELDAIRAQAAARALVMVAGSRANERHEDRPAVIVGLGTDDRVHVFEFSKEIALAEERGAVGSGRLGMQVPPPMPFVAGCDSVTRPVRPRAEGDEVCPKCSGRLEAFDHNVSEFLKPKEVH
jgi:hypothetical protein